MSKAGYNKTAEQCREQLKAEREDWPYFDDMDAVLGTRHATEPPITIDNC